MRSLILGSSALVLLLAAPASAAQPVTTSETDSELPEGSVTIVAPQDGAVIEGSPDAVVPVTIEYENFAGSSVTLSADGKHVGTCPQAAPQDPIPPCTFEVTLAPGLHQLEALGEDLFFDQHMITIEVVDIGAETEGPATDSDTGSTDTAATDPTGGETESDTAATSPTSGATESATGETGGTDGTDGTDGAGGGSGEKEGCGCSASPGAPDLLGLALFALVAPWRRRRRA